ncbi:MAG TPA: hypothetical protein V6C88_13560 [Chroococcidiopsis sp.]
MASRSDDTPNAPDFIEMDPVFRQQVERLHALTIYARWAVAGGLWVIVSPFCLWALRDEIKLWREYFTWTAVRFGLAYNPLPAFGLALCIGMTVSVLLWQSSVIVWGLSDRQRHQLENQVFKIRHQGKSHPLWRWVVGRKSGRAERGKRRMEGVVRLRSPTGVGEWVGEG